MTSLEERALGCMAGQLCGDALGSQVEFKGPDTIKQMFPEGIRDIGPSTVFGTSAGQATDDSELALALARSLIRTVDYDAEDVGESYLRWRASGPFDCGGTIGSSLSALRHAQIQGVKFLDAALQRATVSEANGALMRQSPLAIWGHPLKDNRLITTVEYDTQLTHPNVVCMDSSTVYVMVLAKIIREGLSAEDAYAYALDFGTAYIGRSTTLTAIQLADHRPPQLTTNSGHCIVALQNALYRLLTCKSPAEAISLTAEGGGDTDTNAAIAGALVGAVYGIAAFPDEWIRVITNCRPGPDTPMPRPEDYWPCDFADVTLKLLARGEECAAIQASVRTRDAQLEENAV